MLFSKLLSLNCGGLGPMVVHVLLQLVIFMTKQKSLKYCRRQLTLLSPTWTKSLTKFNPKMQDLKRVLDFIVSKQKFEQFNVFNWCSNVKSYVFEMALNTIEI